MTSTTPIEPGTTMAWQPAYHDREPVTIDKPVATYARGGYRYRATASDGRVIYVDSADLAATS